MFRLTIIIVEYQSIKDVRECIDSLPLISQGVQLTPLVISNSKYSQEGLEGYKQEFGAKVFHSTGTNTGYAGGVNYGLNISPPTDFYLILNPDARWQRGSLTSILSSLDEQPEIGILGPAIFDDSGNRQPTARAFPSPLTVPLIRTPLVRTRAGQKEWQRYLCSNMPPTDAPMTPRCADWVSGGAMFVSQHAIDRIGQMDERYFMYMEDVDWCRSAWSAGLQVIHDPRWEVQHSGRHASSAPGSFRILNKHTRAHVRSAVLYFIKWFLFPARWTNRPNPLTGKRT
jgi:hypothetical protein